MKAPDPLKKNIFETPDGYFDTLPDRIQQRIREEESMPQDKVVSFPRWAYAAAASLLILLVASIFFFQQPESELAGEQRIEELLAEVPQEVMLDYLQTYEEVNLLNLSLTEDEQEELLLQGLDTYEIPFEDYEYEIYELEEYL